MRSGCQTPKRQREEDSSPTNGNSKHRCANMGSCTSGREGISNTDNTHSGKYCVTFFFLNIKFKKKYSRINNLQNKQKKQNNKLSGGVRLRVHITLP